MEDFEKLQQEKGESLLGFALQNARNGAKPGAKQPDMEKEMLEAGYKKTGHRWLTAWDIPKQAAQPQPKKDPAALPEAA